MAGKRGRKCSIKHCNSFQHTHKNLSFFRFPKDPERCKIWIEKSERLDLLEKLNVHEDRVCEKHFDSASFLNDYHNRLHTTAIPTLFLDAPSPQPRPVPKLKPMHSLMPTLNEYQQPFKKIKIDNSDELLEVMSEEPVRRPKPTRVPPHQVYLEAAMYIRQTGTSFRKAAEKFNINYVTLRRFCGKLTDETNGDGGGGSRNGHSPSAGSSSLTEFQISQLQQQIQSQIKSQLQQNPQTSIQLVPKLAPMTRPVPPLVQQKSQHQQRQNFQQNFQQMFQQQQLIEQLHQQKRSAAQQPKRPQQQQPIYQQQSQPKNLNSLQNHHNKQLFKHEKAQQMSQQQQQQQQQQLPKPQQQQQQQSQNTPSPSNNVGYKRPRQIFTIEQEEQLAEFVRDTSLYYNGMSTKDVRTLAYVYGLCNQVEIPLGWRETHQASFDWCLGFIKRNKLTPMVTTSHKTSTPMPVLAAGLNGNHNKSIDENIVAASSIPKGNISKNNTSLTSNETIVAM